MREREDVGGAVWHLNTHLSRCVTTLMQHCRSLAAKCEPGMRWSKGKAASITGLAELTTRGVVAVAERLKSKRNTRCSKRDCKQHIVWRTTTAGEKVCLEPEPWMGESIELGVQLYRQNEDDLWFIVPSTQHRHGDFICHTSRPGHHTFEKGRYGRD